MGASATPPLSDDAPHLYIKPSAPFTSGNVHIGHVRSYSIGDAYTRYRRARGDDLLFAFGFDAFGLPAELGAIAAGVSPTEWVEDCATDSYIGRPRDGRAWVWAGGCRERMQRGGSWVSPAERGRSAYREAGEAGHSERGHGAGSQDTWPASSA